MDVADYRGDEHGERRGVATWEASGVRALRRYLGLSQRSMAEEMGVRQQTVSEWETGLYRPRGASARLLGIIAERAGFVYEARHARDESGEREPRDAGSP